MWLGGGCRSLIFLRCPEIYCSASVLKIVFVSPRPLGGRGSQCAAAPSPPLPVQGRAGAQEQPRARSPGLARGVGPHACRQLPEAGGPRPRRPRPLPASGGLWPAPRRGPLRLGARTGRTGETHVSILRAVQGARRHLLWQQGDERRGRAGCSPRRLRGAHGVSPTWRRLPGLPRAVLAIRRGEGFGMSPSCTSPLPCPGSVLLSHVSGQGGLTFPN